VKIDRKSLVSRHDPILTAPNPYSPLTIGNGEFAFTADVTGLQSFLPTAEGTTPLCTMAQWGWHSYTPEAERSLERSKLRLQWYDAGGHPVGYMTDPAGQEELFSNLRINPHRINLARLGFVCGTISGSYTGLSPDRISAVSQRLDLWRGVLESTFTYDGVPVSVMSAVHPTMDVLSCKIQSAGLLSGKLGVCLSFPYGSHLQDASDWSSPAKHKTEASANSLRSGSDAHLQLRRTLDSDRYYVTLRIGPGGTVKRTGPHDFLFCCTGNTLEVSLWFSPIEHGEAVPDWGTVLAAAEAHWADFWQHGGTIELAESRDPRAMELERRIVLSQYLTAAQCSGSLPPQETGLTCNSWYGKFHLEMHYWHAAHFALWGRPQLLERSLVWYFDILDAARTRAKAQGYRGARWPKMTDPGGEDSPSPIGPLLCWQQPHPIMYAELLRRAGAGKDRLKAYAELVFATADFMADFVQLDETSGRYVLGPPLIPAQESHKPMDTLNPTFELSYWRWGLETAIRWEEAFGSVYSSGSERWRHVLSRLASLPTGRYRNGREVYLAHQRCPDTFASFAKDHPSMLLAFGMLPGRSIDRAVMSATYDAVLESWDFASSWGWDFPSMAMTAARLGRPKDAVDALLMETPKNTYLPNGHNAQLSLPSGTEADSAAGSPSLIFTTRLPIYLPGNGALLLATGMMASGWDGDGNVPAPGFPNDGSWTVAVEGIGKLP